MKFVRFRRGAEVGFGVLEGERTVRVHQGDMFSSPRPAGGTVSLDAVELLPPSNPSKLIALWNNSKVQIERRKRATPKEVLWFIKPANSYLTHGQPIRYPVGESEKVVLEGELGIVIGKQCRAVTPEQARGCIFGYTVINDVTAQDIVMRDESYPQYTRAKAFDTFGVFGPAIATEVDPLTLTIRSFVNGKQCQDFPATDLVFTPWQTVAELARTMTLMPGDVIACGTSLGVEPIKPGDTVEIRIDGIGSLVNPVVA
jgi:2-keto-4-pentenoate hydratase/2-oxohepta-3-ene-1,7-dioic acid hydratase in catechol pathway